MIRYILHRTSLNIADHFVIKNRSQYLRQKKEYQV